MKRNISVGVVVIGDIGRSPRMQYHAYSLGKEEFDVKILGYNETSCNDKLVKDSQLIHIKPPPLLFANAPRLFHFILKVFWTAFFLFVALIQNGRFHVLLVQNPPAIPSLAVCWLYCLIFRSKLIVDWHNFGYSVLSMTVGPQHLLVKISLIYEKFFGRLSHYNLCVTNAMKEYLKNDWEIEAATLYDKPGPTMLPSISEVEKNDLFHRLSQSYGELERFDSSTAVLISSTSWTEDEDFSILLEALKEYDTSNSEDLPFLICIITGKGPLKNYYQNVIKESIWNRVLIVTPWLEAEDYPRLLASANLGVCLHTSASGLDLPMKIVDMFGCKLPVLAYDYPCLSELLRHNENGMVFENSSQLADQLKQWFRNFPDVQEQHVKFRRNIDKFLETDWHSNWTENALPLFLN